MFARSGASMQHGRLQQNLSVNWVFACVAKSAKPFSPI
jgi:hypothetical protein